MANTFTEFFTYVGPNLDNEIPKNPRNPICIYIYILFISQSMK